MAVSLPVMSLTIAPDDAGLASMPPPSAATQRGGGGTSRQLALRPASAATDCGGQVATVLSTGERWYLLPAGLQKAARDRHTGASASSSLRGSLRVDT